MILITLVRPLSWPASLSKARKNTSDQRRERERKIGASHCEMPKGRGVSFMSKLHVATMIGYLRMLNMIVAHVAIWNGGDR